MLDDEIFRSIFGIPIDHNISLAVLGANITQKWVVRKAND